MAKRYGMITLEVSKDKVLTEAAELFSKGRAAVGESAYSWATTYLLGGHRRMYGASPWEWRDQEIMQVRVRDTLVFIMVSYSCDYTTVDAAAPDAMAIFDRFFEPHPPTKFPGEVIQGGVNTCAGGITWVDPDYDERVGAALSPLTL